MSADLPELPAPTEWGQLIRLARDAVGLSIRAAAARAGVSSDNWGHVERGYQKLGDRGTREAPGTASFVARMADVVGVTPDELEDADRADAADVLRVILRRRAVEEEPEPVDPAVAQIMAIPDSDMSQAEKKAALAVVEEMRAAKAQEGTRRLRPARGA